ncbi:MAG: Asp/Glu racemase [Desulfobacterales bacterium]|nr:MAG: Asp/Glu racemase [Desulfobacterales bacterium]
MRVLLVNPNTTVAMTESIATCARRYARADTEIAALNPTKGPVSIEGYFDEAIATEAVLELLIRHRGCFDAYIIGCFGDPGLFAAREIMTAPVIGMAEAAMLTACTLGYRFAILDVMKRTWPQMEDLLMRYGLQRRCVSVRAVEMPVLETESKSERVRARLIAAGRKALEEDRAEVLLLGCAGMSGLDKDMEKVLGVPVLDGVVCAVKMAEGLVDYQAFTSKINAFKPPELKEFRNCSDAIATIGKGRRHARIESKEED